MNRDLCKTFPRQAPPGQTTFVQSSYEVQGSRFKVSIILFLFFGLFIGASAGSGHADIWNSPSFHHYSRAVTLFDKGKLNKCRSELKKSIAEYPQNVPALYLLGDVELRLGHEKKALAAFLEIEKQYQWTDLWSKIAYLYLNTGQLDKAQRFYLKVIKHEPKNAEGLKGLAYVLIKQGKETQALAHLEQAFQLTGDARLGRQLALSLFNRKEYKKAAPLFEKFLSSKTTDPEIHYCLGVIRHTQGKDTEAKEHFQKAVSLKPDYYEASYNLGILYIEAKTPEKAIACFKKCTKIRPKSKEAFQQLGMIYEAYFLDMKKANFYYQKAK